MLELISASKISLGLQIIWNKATLEGEPSPKSYNRTGRGKPNYSYQEEGEAERSRSRRGGAERVDRAWRWKPNRSDWLYEKARNICDRAW